MWYLAPSTSLLYEKNLKAFCAVSQSPSFAEISCIVGILNAPAVVVPKRYAGGAAAMASEAHMGKKYTTPNGKGLVLRHFYLASVTIVPLQAVPSQFPYSL